MYVHSFIIVRASFRYLIFVIIYCSLVCFCINLLLGDFIATFFHMIDANYVYHITLRCLFILCTICFNLIVNIIVN